MQYPLRRRPVGSHADLFQEASADPFTDVLPHRECTWRICINRRCYYLRYTWQDCYDERERSGFQMGVDWVRESSD